MAKTSTKRALLGSAVSLLLCFAMLLGTTFAWFTDNVTSTGNRILAGDLEIDLLMDKAENGTYTSIAGGSGDIFSEAGDGKWEPGKTQIVYLAVRNTGSLALKYNIILDIIDGGLIGSLEYAVIDGAKAADLSSATKWADIKAIANAQVGEVVAGKTVAAPNGKLDAIALTGEEDETDYFALAVHMKEEAGNQYENKNITIDVLVNATQVEAEEDSFGKDYDKAATYPAVGSTQIPAGTTNETELSAGEVTVYIPAAASSGNYKLEVSNKSITTVGDETTVSYGISLFKDDVKVSGALYPIEIEIGTLLNVTGLTHNGNAITPYTYNAQTGIISFETDSFNTFAVTYESMGEDVVVSDGKIIGGVFEGVNPATIDPSLAETDSEYIAINYKEDGKEKYVVSKRSETVVLAAPDTVYTPNNKNYTVKTVASNGLYSEFSAISGNDHTTVYMLQGTYNSATTVSVTSSVDIIGLGDKDSVKVIKGSASSQHLFNCTNMGDKYIEVTIRNLYLEATNKTTKNKLNGAVQSIRRTKVKCYDLTINNGSSNYAFYVNGGNVVDDGTYPTAYMYVENCVVTGTSSFFVVTTKPNYKFYHNNLTYNNGKTYTTNSGSTLNQSMTADDWDW